MPSPALTAEPVEIALGIGQAVDVIDPEPIDQAFPDQGERKPVVSVEDRVIFYAQSPMRPATSKKPPVAELVPGPSASSSAARIVSDAAGRVCPAENQGETLVEFGSERWRRDEQRRFPRELCGGFPFDRAGGSREPFEHGIAVARDRRIAGGIERIESLVIAERQAAVLVVVSKAQIAGCDLFLKRPAEEGERKRLPPVDVEIVGKFAKAAAIRSRLCHQSFSRCAAHVVRDDVQNETESFGFQRMGEQHKSVVAAQVRVDLVVVDDVVAMG